MLPRRPSRYVRTALMLYGGLAAALVALTLVLDKLEPYFGLALLVPYVVIVALAGRWGGLPAAIFISLASVPLVDFFLLNPQGRLDLGLRQGMQLMVVLLAGLLLGWLFERLRVERERAEAAAAAERLALDERDALLSLIAHDLRSPLTAVRARVQLAGLALNQTPPDVSGAARSVEMAVPQVDRISRMLDDLVTTGRADGSSLRVKLVELDLTSLIERVCERWRSAAPTHSIVLSVAGPVSVMGDPDRLEQVLDNLIANAVKYSPPGSPVELRATSTEGEVRVSVKDQGPGIPPEEQSQLFERFYRRPEHHSGRQPGLGLGLYISRELMAAHGGRIWVESAGGDGSLFVIAMPRLRQRVGVDG